MLHSLLESVGRILTEDRLAVVITVGFLLIQGGVFFWIRLRTGTPLHEGKQNLRETSRKLTAVRAAGGGRAAGPDASGGPDDASWAREQEIVATDRKVARAWDLSVGAQRDPSRAADAVEPEIVFASGRLLPKRYNLRLDSAAPGLFTALGIMGTFVGLILGFLQVDPDQATSSVGPLIGGMVVAFVNSLAGVGISIIWSYRSRVRRHDFDDAAEEVLSEAEYRFARVGVGEQLRAGFLALASRLDRLESSTVESSQALLNGLSPKLADSFKMLVATPFEQLTSSVNAFDRVVSEAIDHQERISERLGRTAETLVETKEALAASISSARECVQQFEVATQQLHAGTAETRGLVEQTSTAAGALGLVVQEVRQTSEQHEVKAGALHAVAKALTVTAELMDKQSEAFHGSAERLETAVAEVQVITREGVTESVGKIHRELSAAVEAMLRGVAEAGATTVQAQEDGSKRIVEALDARITDLTGRVSQEFAGIAARLPEQVEAVNRSMLEARTQMLEAYANGTARIVESLETITTDVSGRIATDFRSIAEQFPEQVRALTEQMGEVHARTLQAYRESSDRVVEAVDERMSDLTDRLSAELTTLSNRLPAEVSSLNQAMAQIRSHIQRATRSMDDAVQQLALRTPQALQAQLSSFDSELARAVDHFSGTLMQWDGRIAEIQEYSRDLGRFADVVSKRFPAPKIVEVSTS